LAKSISRTFLTVAFSSHLVLNPAAATAADDKDKSEKPATSVERPVPPVASALDPELSALQKQNAILEERIRLLTQQQQLETLNYPDPLAAQNELIRQRSRLMAQQQTLVRLSAGRATITTYPERREDVTIESVRMAYQSLAGIAPDVAKALACGGKNVVIYGPAQSEALLSVRTFNTQIETLRARLKSILDLRAPTAPDATGTPASPGVYGVGALGAPVLQSVLDLTALFQAHTLSPADLPAEDSAVLATVANSATAQGCVVYWPDQYAANPYNPASQVMASLQTLADLNDNTDPKTAGFQLRLSVLKTELKRAQTMSENLSTKIASTNAKLNEAAKRVDSVRQQIDFISSHIKDEKSSALQEKLNKTFEKAWEELEAAIRRQLGSGLPATIEDQNRVGEMSKRMDLLKTRADWLAQYVRDDKDLLLQDKLKRVLSNDWDQLEAAVRAHQALTASTVASVEADQAEQRRWDRYAADLKELIGVTSSASEAYSTFRTALLDGSSGTSPLSRLLRAETLRDLTFDEKFQERAGSSVVQLKLQRLTGTHTIPNPQKNDKETYSGGVVLSFMQYEPNGKLKNSGVFTGYAAPLVKLKESKAAPTEDKE
jgi:hypothetical protein